MRNLILFLCLFPALAFATTYNSDGSQADVASKISGAVDGDIITLPSGTFTWTSGVTISGKGITIQGAGGGRVEGSSTSTVSIGTGTKTFTIRSGSTITGFTASEAIIVHDKFIAGNTMTGTVTSWNGTTLVISAASSTGSSPTNNWVFEMPELTRINHNAGSSALFSITKDSTNSTEFTGIRLVEGTGSGYGIEINGSGKTTLIHDMRISSIHQGIRDNTNGIVAWYCYFDAGFNISTDNTNNDNGIQCTVASLTSSWTDANTVGMNDSTGLVNVYIEQCFFTGLCTGCVDAADNFRGVLRYSVFDNSAVTIHGQDTDVYGMRHLEAYNNLMIFNALPDPGLSSNQGYWFTWRGGAGIVTDSTIDDISSWSSGNKQEVTLEYQALGRTGTANWSPDGWPGGLDGTLIHYPGSHQPGQGSNGSAAWFSSVGSPPIHTATNTYTEGVYIYSNTGTTAIGLSNYPNDIPGLTPDRSISDYIQLNRDYFTAAPQTGTPYFGYTKYTYPHPLRGIASSTGGSSLGGVLTIGGKITIN